MRGWPWKRLPTATNALTVLVVVAWVASFVVRVFNANWPGASAADAGLLLVLGYWFSSTGTRRRAREESGS